MLWPMLENIHELVTLAKSQLEVPAEKAVSS